MKGAYCHFEQAGVLLFVQRQGLGFPVEDSPELRRGKLRLGVIKYNVRRQAEAGHGPAELGLRNSRSCTWDPVMVLGLSPFSCPHAFRKVYTAQGQPPAGDSD